MKKLSVHILVFCLLSCSKDVENTDPVNAGFVDFSVDGQTLLPTSINKRQKRVKIEVDHDVDVTALTPQFEIPDNYSVLVNGVRQEPGVSQMDLSHPVIYELTDQHNNSTSWEVSTVNLACKILIDASHDGGVWWYPQSEETGFNPNEPHQGQAFANTLREKGFEVTELGRGKELTEEMFFGHYIVIRAGGFSPYTPRELEVYTNLLARGMNLVLFTDHKKFNPTDKLGEHLGLKMVGSANGAIVDFEEHQITNNLESLDYIAGSVLANESENPDIQVLGRLGQGQYADLNFNNLRDANEPVASPVMGIVNYPNSRVFFIGDMNGIEVQPQPFIDNLLSWMGDCSNW